MLGTILAVVIPIVYLGTASALAGHIKRRSRAKRGSFEYEEAIMGAVLVGLLWPISFPFYIQLREHDDDEDSTRRQ